ncbi:hypothetical protein GLOIN_2v1776946 [Rhizophagus irregularis DAOM 181602=DAOM 197198]|nr:hypothetical protein GLOIN_2v1776946 [Rhizophagus irregularis DAOM 181602=DAOM 197198]
MLPILISRRCWKGIVKTIITISSRYLQKNRDVVVKMLKIIIKEFYLPTDTLIQEWAIYCGLNESIEEFDDLDLYWRGKRHILLELSSLALIYIWLPVMFRKKSDPIRIRGSDPRQIGSNHRFYDP